MKKLTIATLIALSATVASAAEFGVTTSRAQDRNDFGVTLGQQFGPVGVTAGFSRTAEGANDQNRFSLTGSYDVVKLGPVQVAALAGGAYLNNQTGSDGFAAVVGAGLSVPVAKNVKAGVEFTRQYGQDRVSQFDGNRVTAGVKFAF
jgi:hypothetical protein